MGVMALLTFARGIHIGVHGTGVVLGGLFAKVYYAYASLAAVLLAMGLLWMVFVRLNGQLAELATRDALTRLLNRTGLDEALRRHFGQRPPPPLTLLVLDLDHFKRINDEHGHAAGDRMLQAVAEVLTRDLRPSDLVARLGGEEFVVCSAAAEPGDGRALAERLRAAVARLEVATAGAVLRCTVSIGVSAPCRDLAGWDAALGGADRALYAAKSAGRDRVVAAAGA
jgi:diguanylate cyclase (GGDEF)-like protein